MTRETSFDTSHQESVAVVNIKIFLPGCSSLKEKRHRLSPLLHRIQKELNLSIAETGLQDYWQSAWISCASVSNSQKSNQEKIEALKLFIEENFPGLEIEDFELENR